MQKSFSTGDLVDITKLKRKLSDHQNIQIVDNQVVSTNQKKRLSIVRANKILNDKHFSNPNTSSPSTLAAAKALLETFGCSVIAEKTRNFSFQEELLNEEDGEIDNPNIQDPNRLRKLKNKQKEAQETFPNAADPFYELDTEIPRKQQLQNEQLKKGRQQKQIIILAADLAKMNLRKQGRPLKYFK